MLRMTVFMMDSTHIAGLQELGVPLCVSTSMHTLPPAVTCPVYLQSSGSHGIKVIKVRRRKGYPVTIIDAVFTTSLPDPVVRAAAQATTERCRM